MVMVSGGGSWMKVGWLVSWPTYTKMRCQESKDYLEFKREAKLRTEMPTRWAPTKYSYTWSYGAPINGSCKHCKWDLQPCLQTDAHNSQFCGKKRSQLQLSNE